MLLGDESPRLPRISVRRRLIQYQISLHHIAASSHNDTVVALVLINVYICRFDAAYKPPLV